MFCNQEAVARSEEWQEIVFNNLCVSLIGQLFMCIWVISRLNIILDIFDCIQPSNLLMYYTDCL